MKPGDLIEFMCIGAGRHDKPPYSNDGSWRIGLLITILEADQKVWSYERSTVLYMGELFTILSKQTRCIGAHHENEQGRI